MTHKEQLLADFPKDAFDSVIEEVGEVLQAIGKYKGFGPKSVNPLSVDPYEPTNYDRLQAELDDLIEACYSLKRHL